MSSRKLLSEQFRREGWDVYEVASVGGDGDTRYEFRPLPGYEEDVWRLLHNATDYGLRFDDPKRPFTIVNWEEWSAVASGMLVVTTLVQVNLSEFKGSREAAADALERKCNEADSHIRSAVRNIIENGMGLEAGDWSGSRFAIEFYGDEYPTDLDRTPF